MKSTVFCSKAIASSSPKKPSMSIRAPELANTPSEMRPAMRRTNTPWAKVSVKPM